MCQQYCLSCTLRGRGGMCQQYNYVLAISLCVRGHKSRVITSLVPETIFFKPQLARQTQVNQLSWGFPREVPTRTSAVTTTCTRSLCIECCLITGYKIVRHQQIRSTREVHGKSASEQVYYQPRSQAALPTREVGLVSTACACANIPPVSGGFG